MKQQIPADEGILSRMLQAYDTGNTSILHLVKRFGVGVIPGPNSSENHEEPIIINKAGYHGCFSARLDINTEPKQNNDVSIKASAYDHIINLIHTDPAKIKGDFAIVLYDENKDQLILLRDQIGLRPLYYTERDTYLAFATDIQPLIEIAGDEIDEIFLADTLSTVRSASSRSFYKSIKKLPPATILSAGRKVTLETYWNIDTSQNQSCLSLKDCKEQFLEKLVSAIKTRIGKSKLVGFELSGGLDSSGILSVANNIPGKNDISIATFSHVLADPAVGKIYPFRDETEFINDLVDHFQVSESFRVSAEKMGVLQSLQDDIFIHSGPSQGSFHLLSDQLYLKAQQCGIQTLFSGVGGDEGVSSRNGGLHHELVSAKEWHAYEEYYVKPYSKYSKHWMKYMLFRYTPLSEKWISSIGSQGGSYYKKLRYLAVRDDLVSRKEIQKRLANVNASYALLDMQAMMQRRLHSSGLVQRLESSYLTAKKYGIEYVYPLLDLNLLEFYYHLPRHFKTAPDMDRMMFRESLEGLMPERIRLRNDKFGTTIPSLQYRIIQDQQNILRLIDRSEELNQHHYLDYRKMRAWNAALVQRTKRAGHSVNPIAFLNSLQVLLLQEMQRTGTFKTGIGC